MPLEKSGIEYTSKGFTKFISDMTKAGDMVVRLGEACDKTAQKLNTAVTGYAAMAQGTKAVSSSVKELTRSISEKARAMDKDNLATKIMITTAALAAQKVKEQYTDMTNHMKSVTALAAQKIETEHENMANVMSTTAALAAQKVTEEYENMSQQMETSAALAKQKNEEHAQSLNSLKGNIASVAAGYQKLFSAINEAGNSFKVNARDIAKESESLFSLGQAIDYVKDGFGSIIKISAAVGNVLGGIFGAIVGVGLVASPIPVLDDLLAFFGGPLLGTIVGALAGVGGEIAIAIAKFFASIGSQLVEMLPKVLRKIYDVAAPIVKAFVDLGKRIITAIVNLVKQIGGAIKSLFSAFSGGQGGYQGLGDSLFGAMFKFEVLKQVIRKVIQEFKDLVNVAVTAAQSLQTLTLRLDNLIARQVRNLGITDDYNKSIAIASEYTQELLGWITELAVHTPFSVDTISKTVSMAMAMGWSIQSTKDLTSAILDYSAAQGLESDVMERIIYNFAQMRQAGKVTGTELRDLARGAFMPVNDVLEESARLLGIQADQFDEFKEAAARGEVSVEAFFNGFISLANKEFPNAARNLNNTFEAVRDNIKDLFKTLVGWNILKPAFDAIAKGVQRMLDALYTPELVRATKIIGISLKYVVEMVQMAMHNLMMTARQMFLALGLGLPTLENLVKSMVKFGGSIVKISFMIQNFVLKNLMPAIRSIGDEIEGVLGDSSDAFSWGFNLIMEFGKGMMRGVSTILTSVMNFIANMLSGWLRGQSPPRIAPEIDLWGLNTMAEWLRGFTEADFSILDSMKDNLRGALDALVDLGELDEQLSAEMYVSISADLIAAIEEFNRTGEMTEVIFEQLSTVSGVFGEELINLLNMQIELAEATERVADAQESYNAAVEATELATSTVHSLVREYNAMLRAGTDNSILEQRLAELNAAELQMLASQEAEQAAQAELDAAEAALDPIREMVALQEELIQQLIDLARAQADAAEAAYDGGGGGAGAGEDGGLPEDVGIGLPDLGPMEDLEGWFEEIKDTALAELRDMWDVLEREWATTFESSFGYNSPFQNAWRRFVNTLRRYWDEELAPALGLPSWQAIADIWEGFDLFPDDPEYEYDIANPPWLPPDMIADDPGEGGIFNILNGIDDIILRLQETWQLFVDTVTGKGMPKDTPGAGAGILGDIIAGFQTIADFVGDVASGEFNLQDLGTQIGMGLIDGFIEGIRVKLSENAVIQFLAGFIQTVLEFFGIASPSTVFMEIGKNLIEGLFEGVLGWITDGWETMETALNNFIDGILTFFGMGKGKSSISGGSSSVFLEVGTALITSLATGVTDTIAAIIGVGGVIATTIQSIIDAVKDALGIGGDGVSWEFTQIGRSIIDGMIAGITEMVDALLQAAEDAVEGVPQFIKDLIGFGSPAKMFIEIGASIPQGLAKGIRDEAGLAQKAMASASRGLFSSASVSGMNVAPMRATVQAPPASAGSSVTFGDVYVNDRIDLATLRTYVQQMILEN